MTMEVQGAGACDEVLALKQFLQGMLLADHDGHYEPSLPEPRKGVIQNDILLEHMGVPMSDASSSGCSAYSLDDERPAAVVPLHILSPQQHQQQNTCHPVHVNELDVVNHDRFDAEDLLGNDQNEVEDDTCNPHQEDQFSRSYVNKTSTKLLRRSTTFEPDFQTRMKQFLLKNQQKKERIRQSLKVHDEPEITPVPQINRRSKCIPRNVSHLMAWNNEKETKLARLRDTETAKQEANCIGKPSISKHSVEIFSKRQDDVALCKVEDRLHLLGLIYQYQQEERKRAEERDASSSVQPRLAPHSANVQRRRRFSVHERLYQLSKRKLATSDNNDSEHCTGESTARRRRERNTNSKTIVDTAQRLHALDKQYKQKQMLLREERKRYFDDLRVRFLARDEILIPPDNEMPSLFNITHQAAPKMNARSRMLAAKKKKIPTPKSPLRCGCCGGKENKEGKCCCTIEPRVNQKRAADIYDRQLKWKNANEARRSHQKQLQDTLSMMECTFRNPFYRKAWNTLDDRQRQSTEKETTEASAAFFNRCMIWAEKRNQQVAQEKKVIDEKRLEECTFKPRVIRRTPKYLAPKHIQSNQQDEADPSSSQSSSPSHIPNFSMTPSPERRDLATEELMTQLYSALDLQALVGELTPQHNSIGSDDEGAHGFPKYTFTDLGEFAGR
ncbi:hypothetical protein F441_02657 [Phytophthora nicotianae CJ01A1]|uniref:Uncharacterized protein n=5 Tax=Phytophthora nicotianae TaxID=4792 RepID=W2PDD3_PHYN3|nr:hypothetical protein PPTG_19358 [Phytophthora nicotianae INRA-310]ETI54489.1 hypothetical protein F443_02696 [Phytophthora nicotianae P1569]ETK94359.1 hypothetical protein L915_02571 [Phytophthora nicotianae]ETO83240.1 hypothetical protein F444_02699 [Phytophthora nicotianae P1976]ETP24315.1 hypothetical protein F441_02657 [Phytophthora nicotianae CJ01A1]ETL47735.1 hypothetical protein L916_02544 [Phytophthora nicotianae]